MERGGERRGGAGSGGEGRGEAETGGEGRGGARRGGAHPLAREGRGGEGQGGARRGGAAHPLARGMGGRKGSGPRTISPSLLHTPPAGRPFQAVPGEWLRLPVRDGGAGAVP